MKIDRYNQASFGGSTADKLGRSKASSEFAGILKTIQTGVAATATTKISQHGKLDKLPEEVGKTEAFGGQKVEFNSVLDGLLQQPELTSMEKFQIVGEAALRNLSNFSGPMTDIVGNISSILQKLGEGNPHILQASKAWLEKMQIA